MFELALVGRQHGLHLCITPPALLCARLVDISENRTVEQSVIDIIETGVIVLRNRVDARRTRVLSEGSDRPGPVVYWMSRDQRMRDNWALMYASQMAKDRSAPLVVLFSLVPEFLGATARQYAFMLNGLEKVANGLASKGIPFRLELGEPSTTIPQAIKSLGASIIVSDFNPLRVSRQWKNDVIDRVDIPVIEVDAHNIVPCWLASDKQEFAARTFRPKVISRLDDFLTDLPNPAKQTSPEGIESTRFDSRSVFSDLPIDSGVAEVDWIEPGEDKARAVLKRFIKNRLSDYAEDRNDPNADVLSDLSPYLHFGQISAQRVALEIAASNAPKESRDAFIEELIVRRELSDNFCYYNDVYDSIDGFPDWAKRTLDEHRGDLREYLYSRDELEFAETHDQLWNAAQIEMVRRGKMHGYMRMYWAKKILEWTGSPEDALAATIYLNDRYELDGRDPNGYVGAAWSIGGVHDRAWQERPVYGKIRYMNYSGCRRKFDVDAYIERIGVSKK